MSQPAAKIEIRPMCAADVDAVLGLAKSLKDAPHWPRAAYLQALDPFAEPRRIALVAANADGAMGGFVVASVLSPQAELETIAVAAASQRRGLARRLLLALAQELRLAGVAELFLEVRVTNQPALSLYRSLGFAETGRRPRYYADPVEDAVLMALPLG